ncbi:MAG: carboxypeptidase regulatory-like domain-containing protein [Gemmatimonadaceae bacterium]
MKDGGRAALLAMIAVCAAAALPRSLCAQVVRGTVTDSASRRPISGAVVTLVDGSDAILGRSITNERGEFGVTSRRGAKSIHVVRIGFQPRDFPVDNATDPGRSIEVTMAPFTTRLATVRVTEKSGCPRSSARNVAFAFWDQARAGLLNSVVAAKANPMSLHRLYFSRVLDVETGSIKSFIVNEDSTSSTETSFTSARSTSELVSKGFAGDTGVVGYMFGPDEDILGADAFAQGYCFRLAPADKTRPGQVGVRFGAADVRRGRVDIEGTIWIDTVAHALRDAEFQYVGVPRAAVQFHPGGTMSFATAANGVVFIDRWSLHLIGNDPVQLSPACRTNCRMRDRFYPAENGAEVSHAVWHSGLRWDAQLGTVTIRATTRRQPAATGTVMQLASSPYHGTADASGTVTIADLVPGPYALKVGDPRLDGLGILLPTSAKFTAVRDSTVRLSLELPTVEGFVMSQCRANGKWTATDSTYLLGRVVDAQDNPVADASVTFAVRHGEGAWTWDKETLRTDADGVFASCGTTLNPGGTLQVRVESEGALPHSVTSEIESKTSIVPIQLDPRP